MNPDNRDAVICALREALEFYASPLGWTRSRMEIGSEVMGGDSPCECDRGTEAREALASTAQAGEDAERRIRQDEQVRMAPFLVHPYPCPNHASEDPVNDLLGCTCGLAAILGTESGEGR